MFISIAVPKTGYSQAATQYTQAQQTRQVTAIKPAAPSPVTSTFPVYPVSSAVQPVAAATASVVPSYSQSATYSTNAVTYSGKQLAADKSHVRVRFSEVLRRYGNPVREVQRQAAFMPREPSGPNRANWPSGSLLAAVEPARRGRKRGGNTFNVHRLFEARWEVTGRCPSLKKQYLISTAVSK